MFIFLKVYTYVHFFSLKMESDAYKLSDDQLSRLRKYFNGLTPLQEQFNKWVCPGIPNFLFATNEEDAKKYLAVQQAKGVWWKEKLEEVRLSCKLTWDEIRKINMDQFFKCDRLPNSPKLTIDDFFDHILKKRKEIREKEIQDRLELDKRIDELS